MKEHRKHPPGLGYPGDGAGQVQVDRHGNIRVSLREKEKRKALVRKSDWEGHVSGSKVVDDRDVKRFKVQRDNERERLQVRRVRDEERLRLTEAVRERDRRIELKKLEKEKMRHRIVERERVARVKRAHEVNRDLTPVRSPIRSPKSCSSRSQGEIRARTPSESPPRSKLRSIVRSAPKSPTPVAQLSPKTPPTLIDPKPDEPTDFTSNSIVPCDSVGSPDGTSLFDNCESKSEHTIVPVEDMSPISNSSSLGDIDAIEGNLTPDKTSFIDDDAKESPSVKQSEDIVSDENFSDWSEDEDELLNKPSDKSSPPRSIGTPSEESINPPPSESTDKSSLMKEVERVPSVEPSSSSLKPSIADSISIESQDACSSLQDDALESISDDECDAIIGKGEMQEATLREETTKILPPLDQEAIEDLDIDWSNLIQQPKPVAPESGSNSARRRMFPANILARIGFSHEHAGPKLTEKLINHCKEELKDNFIPFRHKVASLHSFIGEQISMREKLFESSNFFSSALSARKDLDIRKILAQTFADFSYLQSTPSELESSPKPIANHSTTSTDQVKLSPPPPLIL